MLNKYADPFNISKYYKPIRQSPITWLTIIFIPKFFSKFKIYILPILNNGSENGYSGAAEGGWTPLHLAAKYLHKDVCKLILGHVTDKNPEVDNVGRDTPQHLMFHAQCKCWRETKTFF